MDMTIAILIIIFVLMLIFPLFMSTLHARLTKAAILDINQKRQRHPRYFANSFALMIENALQTYNGNGKIQLSKAEDILDADHVQEFPAICSLLVLAIQKDLHITSSVVFEKEIYAAQHAYLYGVKEVRAICGKQNVVLGEGSIITRWADAGKVLKAEDHCDLGMSASSQETLLVGRNCIFRRLYAPCICLGQNDTEDLPDKDAFMQMLTVSKQKTVLRDIKIVDEALCDEAGVLAASIISKHSIRVVDGLTVLGNIRSHGAVSVYDDVTIYGNVFAEGDIYLGENVRVLGNIFTQQKFFAQKGVHIGQYGGIKSVIARDSISFQKDCRVYGYVSSETGGFCCMDADDGKEEISAETDNASIKYFISSMQKRERSVYLRQSVFDNMNPVAFRRNPYTEEIVFPYGVEYISGSCFYGCRSLRSVTLPSTLKRIERFAFYECAKLKVINLGACTALEYIGESAFAECTSLESIILPVSLKHLGAAAFMNCTQLKSVLFAQDSQTIEIEGHAFMNCSAMESIQLPAQLQCLGMSVFYGCAVLQEVSLPQSTIHIGGHAFHGCTALHTLYVHAPTLEVTQHILEGTSSQLTVHAATEETANILRGIGRSLSNE